MAELDWTPANMVQGEDRSHRIGARSNVLSQWLVMDGSLDSRMAQELVRKAEIVEQALDRQEQVPMDSVWDTIMRVAV
jgi:SWI/SNF-related matrix-associated actin-dependent regulator 1 of chromatin subfamily A